MTAFTPIYGWGYPENADPPNGPSQFNALATAIEATVDSIDDRVDVLEPKVASLEAGTSTDRKFVIKAIDTSRASTTVLADDPHLLLNLGVGTWMVTLGAHVTGSSGNFNMDFTTTGSVNMQGRMNRGPGAGNNAIDDGTANMTGGDSAGTDQAFGTDDSGGAAEASGVTVQCMYVVTVASVLTLRWAQNSSQAAATVVKAGSWMTAIKFA